MRGKETPELLGFPVDTEAQSILALAIRREGQNCRASERHQKSNQSCSAGQCFVLPTRRFSAAIRRWRVSRWEPRAGPWTWRRGWALVTGAEEAACRSCRAGIVHPAATA